MIRKNAWFLVLLIVAAACLDEPDCYLLNNYVIGISFKKIENSSADTVSLTAYGPLEPPLPFYVGDTTMSRVFLPLNYFEEETAFVFQNGDSLDFLQLTYLSQAQFVSEDCGEKFVLSNLRVGKHSFDSVRLVVDIPTREGNTINIEIFQ